MKTLLRIHQCFEETQGFFGQFRKMTSLRMIIFMLLTLSLSNNTFSQTANQVNEHANFQNTAGTFQFESPTGNLFFWNMDFIESLYPGIESRRAASHNTIWHFNADMDIIIFAENIVTSSDFVPLESPYKGLKEYKY